MILEIVGNEGAMETVNRSTYEAIATEFSKTRYSVWKCVRKFAESLHPHSQILDVGCGNGKNMMFLSKNHEVVGADTCHNFITICNDKGLEAVQADGKVLPFATARFDAVLCVAMFHHLLTDEDRCRTFKEILRVLKPGGRGLLTVWSTEQPTASKFHFVEGVNVVPWNGREIRYYYVFSERTFLTFFQSFSEIHERVYNECGNWILVFIKTQ